MCKGGGRLLGITPKTQPGLPCGLTVVSGEGCARDAPAQCPAHWPDPSTQTRGIFLGSEQWGGFLRWLRMAGEPGLPEVLQRWARKRSRMMVVFL